MKFQERHRIEKEFKDLNEGDAFLVRHMADCSVDPIYYDCVCVKTKLATKQNNKVEFVEVAMNLTLSRIEELNPSTKVELLKVKLVEE